MKHFIPSWGHSARKHRRHVFLGLVLLLVLVTMGGCDSINGVLTKLNPNAAIDKAINEINDTESAIQTESGDWRAELDKLANELSVLESQANADAQVILTDTMSGVNSTISNASSLADATAKDIIASAGQEARCNGDFVKDGALEQLDYLKQDLQFWKQNKQRAHKPSHHTCALNPSSLSLYQSGSSWLIDTSAMPGYVLKAWGYNFWPDRMPTLVLQDAAGHTVRNVSVRPAYVTSYQINLDFSTEKFPDIQPGWRVQFNWPSPEAIDPNTISLILRNQAQLVIKDISLSPAAPVATNMVHPTVTIMNNGGQPSGPFTGQWTSYVGGPVKVQPENQLQPGQSVTFSFQPVQFPKCGPISSNITILYPGGQADSRDFPIQVASYCPTVIVPPPAPEREFGSWPTSMYRKGSPTGDNATREFGSTCSVGYHHSRAVASAVTSSLPFSKAECRIDGWTSDDPHMCKARISIWAEAGSNVDCTVQVYEIGDERPTPTPPPSCSCRP